MTAAEEIVKTMRDEIARHPGLTRAADARAYLEGARDWLFFHAPRLRRNLVVQMAMDMVREAASRFARTGSCGDPPRVPDETRAVWEDGR